MAGTHITIRVTDEEIARYRMLAEHYGLPGVSALFRWFAKREENALRRRGEIDAPTSAKRKRTKAKK